MLQPKKQKFRKQFRRSGLTIRTKGSALSFGEYGLKSQGRGWVSAAQIEAARRSLAFFTRRGGKVWVRIFPDKPITKKAAGARMGSGKGDIFAYVCAVNPGRVMFEIAGVAKDVAEEAMRRASHKLPIKTNFIIKE